MDQAPSKGTSVIIKSKKPIRNYWVPVQQFRVRMLQRQMHPDPGAVRRITGLLRQVRRTVLRDGRHRQGRLPQGVAAGAEERDANQRDGGDRRHGHRHHR